MLFVFLFLFGCAKATVYEAEKPSAPPPVPQMYRGASKQEELGHKLYHVAGCVGCHSPPFTNATHLGGDRDLPTIFGRFYAPNISPHDDYGIGGWSEADFFRAMRHGISPNGRAYWPTFPYMAYTKMSDEDIRALWVYIQSQEPVTTKPRRNEINPNYRFPGIIRVWRWLAFQSGVYVDDPKLSKQENRGAYLVKAVAYCDQCHTPRNRLGLLDKDKYMAGGANPGKSEVHPNLTTHLEKGIGHWSEEDIVAFLSSGIKPDGSYADPNQVMAEKIADSYRYFSTADKYAIAVYLRSLPAIDYDPSHNTAQQ